MKHILVIGGGPSSVLFALTYKRKHPEDHVTVYEKDDRILKRILVSGNGRANFFNADFLRGEAADKFLNPDELNRLISRKDAEEFLTYLTSELGFAYYIDEKGRFYPFSNTASSLRDTLIKGLNKEKIEVKVNSPLTQINPEKKTVRIHNESLSYDKLFLGLGNLAYDRKELDLVPLWEDLGVHFKEPSPALCPLKTREKIPAYLNGTRLKGHLYLYKDEDVIYEEEGELLLKKDGISGICVFDASLYTEPGKDYRLAFNPFEHDGFRVDFNSKTRSIDDLLGLFPYPFVKVFIDRKESHISANEIRKSLSFHVSGTYSLKESQIAKGGISLDQISNSFALKKHPDICIGGESLDCHAICGGYNMGFAFLSGMIAGNN